MKRLITCAVCLLVAASSFAQNTKKSVKIKLPPFTTLPQKKHAYPKNAIGGYITDFRKRPVTRVKAYVYGADSTIIASGFTDSSGYYETNSMTPGLYNLRLIYPNIKPTLMITGVPVAPKKITNISFLKSAPPEADTTIAYTDIAPKPVEKPKKTK